MGRGEEAVQKISREGGAHAEHTHCQHHGGHNLPARHGYSSDSMGRGCSVLGGDLVTPMQLRQQVEGCSNQRNLLMLVKKTLDSSAE